MLSAIAVNALSAFSGKKSKQKSSTPEDFLPYKIDDVNSEKYKLKSNISTRTAKLVIHLWETNKIPPPIQRIISADKDLYSAIKEISDGY